MLVHCELFTDVSIVKEHGFGLHNCQTTLWPNSLYQSCTNVAIKCHQGRTNAIPICDQRFISISNMFGDVFFTQFFPILNESGYAFDDFRPILHGVGFARLWICIHEQTFPLFVLTSHEYTIFITPIRAKFHVPVPIRF